MRKSAFCICKINDADQLCGNREADHLVGNPVDRFSYDAAHMYSDSLILSRQET